jgi:hypothetical protein
MTRAAIAPLEKRHYAAYFLVAMASMLGGASMVHSLLKPNTRIPTPEELDRMAREKESKSSHSQ